MQILHLFKWFLAPVALLTNFLLAMPFGKLFITLPRKPEVQNRQLSELSDPEIAPLDDVRGELERYGYTPGQLLRITNLGTNLVMHVLTMVHETRRIGVGVNFQYAVDAAGKAFQQHCFVEFSLTCSNGKTLDLTNMSITEPYVRPEPRLHINFKGATTAQMISIAQQSATGWGCGSSEEEMGKLKNNATALLEHEYSLLVSSLQAKGLMAASGERMRFTWRGAAFNVYRTMWPTSVLVERSQADEAADFLEHAAVDAAQPPES